MKIKLTPPRRDMNVWTILFIVLGIAMITWGFFASLPLLILNGALDLVGCVGIWIGKPGAKWFFIIPVGIAALNRTYLSVVYPFDILTVFSGIFAAFLAVRFIAWRPVMTATPSPNEESA